MIFGIESCLRFERLERKNKGAYELICSCVDQVVNLSVGGDRVRHGLWRAREGGVVQALRDAGRARQTDVFVLGSSLTFDQLSQFKVNEY